MQFIILANQLQKQELSSKKINPDVEVIYVSHDTALLDYTTSDVMLLLNPELSPATLNKLESKSIFLNSVSHTLNEGQFPKSVSRINGWMTFLKNDVWEIVSLDEKKSAEIFNNLGWQHIFVNDDPGFVSARIIAMIINEAYFALGDGVSSKEEIDVAMKLGTNYPYGPFEWCEKIGLKNIHSLLVALNRKSERYKIAPLIEKEVAKFNL